MSIDVFPEPVGPMTRLNTPFLKMTSPSMCKRNAWLEGVSVPSDASLDHENVDLPKPMSALWLAEESTIVASAFFSVYSSSSSVWKRLLHIAIGLA